MIHIGEYNTLKVLRFTSVGAYLGDAEDNDILLPNKYLVHDLDLDDEVTVFVYNDSEDRPVATTETPLIFLNSFAVLNVTATSSFGAFLDWGLEKDLLVPFKEQGAKMKEGGNYLVFMYRDEQTNRLVATAKINKHVDNDLSYLNEGDEVELLICDQTDLGRKVIVNNKHLGLIFSDRIIKPLRLGEKTTGFVETLREDGKIDISLTKIGLEKFDDFTNTVMEYLKENNNRMFLTDKSDPDEIRAMLGMSKKSFKKAVGNLYKLKKITLHEDHIALLD